MHFLLNLLQHSKVKIKRDFFRVYSTINAVSIGEVSKTTKSPKNPEYVPHKYYKEEDCGQTTLHHLRWMMQKDVLGQDIFLIGPPGHRRRNIAMQYSELINREMEYVSLNRDTTESDLKQRREIVAGNAVYLDQSAVRAAIEGRILVLEGIEKAERNVLPVLNNLLENREMHLEDGRLLIPAERYDKLLQKYTKDDLDKWKLVRVDEDFRVIALGLPVPRYLGNPLDPPLRSRFQARDVHHNSYQEWLDELKHLAPSINTNQLEQLLSAAFTLLSKESLNLGLPDFPLDQISSAVQIWEKNPHLTAYHIFYRLYPYKTFLKDNTAIDTILKRFNIHEARSVTKTAVSNAIASENEYVENNYQNETIRELMQTAEVADFCIIGPKGCGKSILVKRLSQLLNRNAESIILYQDMTARDLIQQRTTLDNGDTLWRFSPLIEAALEGKIAIIDGIHRIHPSTLTVLHRLIHDRELQLHDGKRLIGSDRYEEIRNKYNLTEAALTDKGLLKVHPDFRIIAIGEPSSSGSAGNWLTPELLSYFLFHEIRTLSKNEEINIIESKVRGQVKKTTIFVLA